MKPSYSHQLISQSNNKRKLKTRDPKTELTIQEQQVYIYFMTHISPHIYIHIYIRIYIYIYMDIFLIKQYGIEQN